MKPDRTNDGVIQEMDALHARMSSSQRSMFELISEADRQEAWQGSEPGTWLTSSPCGADLLLEGIPLDPCGTRPRASARLSEALRSGQLGIDKLVELARFATMETESDLVALARGVSVGRVRREPDVTVRQVIEDVRDAQASRFLSWWYFDDGRRFGLEAELPAAEERRWPGHSSISPTSSR
jgi:hypothetical protein